MNRGIKISILALLIISSVTALIYCGGGGDGSTPTAPEVTTKYNASAAAGDYIKLTVDLSEGTYRYENVTTGRIEDGTVIEDPTTKELTFTVISSTGGGSGDGSVTELITGFVAPNIGIVLLADNTGASNIKSMVFGVPHRNHVPSDLINLVPTGSSANYIIMNFRTLDSGWEIAYADLKENQNHTDEADLNNDGSVVDIISGAPLYGEFYSAVYGVPDPSMGLPFTIFSEDIINPKDLPADQVPFVEAASDGSHLVERSWNDDIDAVIEENKMFFNSTLDKFIVDTGHGNAILLKRPGNSSWSANYEGTYYLVGYNGEGVSGELDTLNSVETLVFEISNDGSGNGLISVVGKPDYQNIPLTSFQDLESAGPLLGDAVSPWPDGTPLNGVFGFTVDPNPDPPGDLGGEFFFIFSEGVMFYVSAELTGPRDISDRPASYTYGYGGGLKIQ